MARALDAIALPVGPEVIERGRHATAAMAEYFREPRSRSAGGGPAPTS